MKITIFGTGYVGLVAGVCLSELGHDIYCFDTNPEKIAELQKGNPVIYEDQLESYLERNLQNKHIQFGTDHSAAIAHADIIMIAIGTPQGVDGHPDLQNLFSAILAIAKNISEYKLIIIKSTVPVGTIKTIADIFKKNTRVHVDVVSNPEFLREGNAIADFMRPDRIVVGTTSEQARTMMSQIYAPLTIKNIPLIFTDIPTAEFAKYATNAFLATKVSFMNELSNIAESVDVDIEGVKHILGADHRISVQFMNPGCGFGGSCFPKDLLALITMGLDVGYTPAILQAVQATNEQQQERLFNKIKNYFNGDLNDKVIALWGLAFKPNTDDIRCAPSCTLMERLWEKGVTIQAYDPAAMTAIKKQYKHQQNLKLVTSECDALINADALVIVTEWEAFQSIDIEKAKSLLKKPVIFDGRNLYNPSVMEEHGFDYISIGRPARIKAGLKHSTSMETA